MGYWDIFNFSKFPCARSRSGILGSSSGILGYIQLQVQEQPFGSGILGYIQFLQISMCQIQEWDIGIQQWGIGIYSIPGLLFPKFPCPRSSSGILGYIQFQIQEQPFGSGILGYIPFQGCFSPKFPCPRPMSSHLAVGYWDIFNYRAAFLQTSMSQIQQWDIGIQQWDIGIYSIPGPGAAIWQWDVGIYSIPGLLFPRFPCPRSRSSHLAVGYWDPAVGYWDPAVGYWDVFHSRAVFRQGSQHPHVSGELSTPGSAFNEDVPARQGCSGSLPWFEQESGPWSSEQGGSSSPLLPSQGKPRVRPRIFLLSSVLCLFGMCWD
ncbi:uncharacterized protein LOC132085142 [Ammospiza nelsoni]|uniref:uncharacterized protein LOC132085142 n=1 Tax=Ammospiza nelsoni TaxID=2857394 RepID=UPI00286A5630|nr:uncharacterized protein LOC132085142 [Ammospiza nelsoni]XP_059346502.1 uncharacterized protein LOC132085142 [Ammospiza nelsoni]XP_059346503.1 uncharacterized protein LOC132085142 [Ammospiza nelsoni]